MLDQSVLHPAVYDCQFSHSLAIQYIINIFYFFQSDIRCFENNLYYCSRVLCFTDNIATILFSIIFIEMYGI